MCRYAECHYVECYGNDSITMLSIIMLSDMAPTVSLCEHILLQQNRTYCSGRVFEEALKCSPSSLKAELQQGKVADQWPVL